MTSESTRRERGEAILKQMFGAVPAVPETSREMMDLTVEHLFGDVWSRPGLGLRDRSLITVAVLAALGREAQLALHLRGALNLGLAPTELKEAFMHVAWTCAVARCRQSSRVAHRLRTPLSANTRPPARSG